MKRTLTLFLVAAVISLNGIFAAPVNPDRAKQTAVNFLIQKSTVAVNGNTNLRMLKTPSLVQIGDELAVQNRQFFVFNHGNGQGYVIVSADDRAFPILAYADEGSFDPNNIPPNMQKWLEGYKAEIRWAVENNIEATPEIQAKWQALENGTPAKTSNATKSISALCSTKWDQSPYYNQLCPTGTPTGCVATAMAQVMKYWNSPSHGTGFHSYNHSTYGTLSANFGSTTYNWADMPNQLTSSSSATQKTAVATLMYHCGVAVDMDYEPSGSGAYTIGDAPSAEHALKTYFGYKSTLQGLHKSNYTNANWINLLKTELDAGRPIVYAGRGDGGGHAFVCDGYDNSNYFHFNWGWAGQNDGYYALTALVPGSGGAGGGSYSFTDDQRAIIGIEPANGGTTPTTYDLRLYSNLNISSQIWFGSQISLDVNIANYGTGDFSGQLGAAVFDAEGYFVDFLQTGNVAIESQQYNNWIFTNTGGVPFIPGNYIAAIFYKTSSSEWQIVADGNYTNYKEFEIYYSSDIETNSAFTIINNGGKLIQGSSATVNVDVTNTGSNTFYGGYRVSISNLDGSWAQNIQILNENNGLPTNYHYSGGNNFTGTITVEPGTYLMEIAYQTNGSSGWYYCGSSNFLNPVYVIVEAPAIQPDIYENNNTQSQAYNLSVGFSGNNAIKNTNGSNFHEGNDIDYYKIVFPAGYNYTITPRLHDNYNSGNGQTYTVDALFSYSTNGTAYSETYDDVISGNIAVNNGGTVYFKVAPYFQGSTGTYLLDMSITRTPVTAIEDIELNNKIVLYPNPASDFFRIENGDLKINSVEITDLTGKIVLVSDKTEINISSLPDGAYLLQIHSDKGILSKKLIVKK